MDTLVTQIPLTQNKFALVDFADFIKLKDYKWFYHHGYAGRNINGKTVYMQVIINNTPKGWETDHINHDKLDNRKSNLRTVNRQQNALHGNGKIRKNNTSGYKGVVWQKTRNNWRSNIRVNQKTIFLGYYSDIQEAYLARKQAERLYYG